MKNQIFLVFDSLRWDIFKKAKVPYLKSLGSWKKAYTPGLYTLPAHMSFFAGKLPQSLDDTQYYDDVVTRINRQGHYLRKEPFWRLNNPEAPRPARISLEGKNIVEGFRNLGYVTIGTGAVNWFNPELPTGRFLTDCFEEYIFFDGPDFSSHASARKQVEWALNTIRKHEGKPYFLFINMGETHSRFVYEGCAWYGDKNPYGNPRECREKQKLCLEYLDGQIRTLFKDLVDFDLVVTSDHGEAMGEKGFWGHGFFHETVVEVPMLIKCA